MMGHRVLATKALKLLLLANFIHAPSVYADSDGRINFIGGLTAQTCNISVNGTAASSTSIRLPVVSRSMFNNEEGVTKGDTDFKFSLTGCTNPTSTMARVYFQSGPHVNSDGTLDNKSSPGASGVALQIYDTNRNPIRVGDPSQLTTAAMPLAVMTYTVKYVTISDAVGRGAFSTDVTYSISYE